MTSKPQSKGTNSMVKIVIVTLVIILAVLTIGIAFIAAFFRQQKQTEEQNRNLVKSQPDEIQKYLEEKYGRQFIIDPHFEARPNGPIPAKNTNAPYIYEVYENQDKENIFWTYVYPQSAKNQEIKEIEDNYCWKYVKQLTKEYLEREMAEMLPEEYRIIFLADPTIKFDASSSPTLLLEDYISNASSKVYIRIYIVTPPGRENENLTEDKISPILSGYYNKSKGNARITFIHYQAETYDGYKDIDVKELEDSVFYLHQERTRLKEYVNFEKKLKITIE